MGTPPPTKTAPRPLRFKPACKPTRAAVGAWIYFDVDRTLCPAVIEYARQCQAADNVTVLWSARGEEHARRSAERLDALDAFDHIQSKPAAIIDDQGLAWLRFTQVIHPGGLKMFRFCGHIPTQVFRERGVQLCVQTFSPLNTSCSVGTRGFVQFGAASATRQMLPAQNGGAFPNSKTISPSEYSYRLSLPVSFKISFRY